MHICLVLAVGKILAAAMLRKSLLQIMVSMYETEHQVGEAGTKLIPQRYKGGMNYGFWKHEYWR